MAVSHNVRQGEHVSSLADKYGFFEYQTIWNHPKNSGLKAKRQNPNVLFPGDVLYIPDKQQKTVGRPTTQVHFFQITPQPLKLKVIVLDRNRKPLPNADCELEIEGQVYKLKTDATGLLEKPITRTDLNGNLKVTAFDLESPVKIGHLDPVEEKSGQLGRLANLGYYRGALEPVDDEEFESAVEEFQCDYKLQVDGVMGAQTMAKLKSVHGC